MNHPQPEGRLTSKDLAEVRREAEKTLDLDLIDYYSADYRGLKFNRSDAETAFRGFLDEHPLFANTLRELTEGMQARKYDLLIKELVDSKGETAAVVVTCIHSESASYAVPNINLLYEAHQELPRGESLNDRRKRVMTAADTDTGAGSIAPRGLPLSVEVFDPDSPVRLVLRPGTEAEKPFELRVQFSDKAFVQALSHLSEHLEGNNNRYSFLFHELLTAKIQEDLHELSSGRFGRHEIPQIDSESSRLTRATVDLKVYCPEADTADAEGFAGLSYRIHQNDFFDPFPGFKAD